MKEFLTFYRQNHGWCKTCKKQTIYLNWFQTIISYIKFKRETRYLMKKYGHKKPGV